MGESCFAIGSVKTIFFNHHNLHQDSVYNAVEERIIHEQIQFGSVKGTTEQSEVED